MKIAVFIDQIGIAGEIPAVGDVGGLFLGIVKIAAASRAADGEAAE